MADLEHPLVLRDVDPADYSKGHLELLKQLTQVGDITQEEYSRRVGEVQKLGDHHRIVVIENVESKSIVATATLFVELKLARHCGKVGHIEDVVVDQTVRGQHLGKRIVCYLTEAARSLGCYKVILDCNEANVPFYESCGFKSKELQMALYF